MHILSGDLGGTKTNLHLYRLSGSGAELLRSGTFASRDHSGLGEIVTRFLRDAGPAGRDLSAAAMGVAGPVIRGRSHLVNLGWDLDESELSAAIGGAPFRLMNDLVATAHGILALPADRLEYLQGSPPEQVATSVVMAPGTGLGIAILAEVEGRLHPLPTEGGHADFTPLGDFQVRLRDHLARTERPVSVEHVLSGRGFSALYRFLLAEAGAEAHPDFPGAGRAGDPNAAVVALALSGTDSTAIRAVAEWVSILGAEAGNLALRTLARGGVFLGGGIPPKILPALRQPGFLEAFRAKSNFSAMLAEVPVAVVLEPEAAVLGARVVAEALARR